MMASYSTSWQPCLHGTQFCLFLDENLTGIDNKIWLKWRMVSPSSNLKFCYGNRHFGRGDASRNGGHPITLSNDRMAKEINFSLRSCMKLSQWRPISFSFLPNQNSSPTSWPETPLFIFFGNAGPPCARRTRCSCKSAIASSAASILISTSRQRKAEEAEAFVTFVTYVTSDLFILNHG